MPLHVKTRADPEDKNKSGSDLQGEKKAADGDEPASASANANADDVNDALLLLALHSAQA